MITTCTGCQTHYRLDEEKVPQRLIRVRCPKCKTVFMLDGVQAAAKVEKSAEDLVLERPGDGFQFSEQQQNVPPITKEPVGSEAARVEQPTQPAATNGLEELSRSGTAVAVEDEAQPRPRRKRDKARMLARALVSDILVYNRETRDQALKEGTLLEVLGPEIKKSWELYKEKVTPEVANSTTHFRDALNEILADGQKVF